MKVSEAQEYLSNSIAEFYKKNPMARFDDIPNSLFVEAMESYHQERMKEELIKFAKTFEYEGKR